MKAQVLLPKVFNFPFTYNSKNENKIGNLVEVPFGSKNEIVSSGPISSEQFKTEIYNTLYCQHIYHSR